jgi:hypothetical protein
MAQLPPNLDKVKIPGGKPKLPPKENKENAEKPSGSTGSATGATMSQQEQESWYNFYQQVTQEWESMVWKEGVYPDYFMSQIGNDFNKLQKFKWVCVELDKRIENDKKRSPETFRYYGNKQDMPAGMEYGGPNDDALPSRLKWTNSSITKYYQWKPLAQKQQAQVAEAILKYVEASKERISANPELNTRIAYEYVNIAKELTSFFETLQGSHTALQQTAGKVEAQRQAIIQLIKSKITGKFHENNLQRVVAFTSTQQLGKENEAEITQELIPGKFAHIVAYAVEPQQRFGAKSRLSTGNRETQPGIYFQFNATSANPITVSQKIYCNQDIFTAMKDKYYVEFEWFPDLSVVNYKSHLHYMPIHHLGQYMMRLQNGKYTVNMLFGDDIHTDIGARGTFTILMNDDIRNELKSYLDKLWAKKLETVTFNSQYGEKDQRNLITNWEELKKFGYPERVTVERTGQVMKPWPRENEVESYVGSGWALCKREDGKYEVIGLSFVQKPGEQKWRWTAVASDMDYYLLLETGAADNFRIHPTRMGQGYEIPAANISKNGIW